MSIPAPSTPPLPARCQFHPRRPGTPTLYGALPRPIGMCPDCLAKATTAGLVRSAEVEIAQASAEFAENPIVNAAEQALRSFDDDMGREVAEALLASWKHTPELSAREIRAILARFSVGGAR